MDAPARTRPPEFARRGAFRAWGLLALAALWAIVLRVPIVLNATQHLDSDLAVDGLTLLEASRGHFRWHYPGTPFMGCGSVLLSLPQAWAWGVNPSTLVSGGVVAFLGLMLATFVLAWIAFDARVAAWSLVPLTFASTGSVWLSGRITGGHLLAACWHAMAFALLAQAIRTGRRKITVALGFVCGLGLYLDSMFAVSLVGIVAASGFAWAARGFVRSGLVLGVMFVVGFGLGFWPRPLGARLEPHDAYREQLSLSNDPAILKAHASILAFDCLPRLLFGHRLPRMESDPDPSTMPGSTLVRKPDERDLLSIGIVGLGMAVVFGSVVGLMVGVFRPATDASRPVVVGLAASAAAILAGFVANRNIFNADNYRYLVDLLVVGALGFGIVGERMARAGGWARGLLIAGVVFYGALMTADVERWYARFGWVDGRGWPVRVVDEDATLAWLERHREVDWIVGGYWDVYRLAFLSGGRVKGVPFAIYPDRFPEWSRGPKGQEAWLLRPSSEGRFFQQRAQQEGRRIVQQARGVSIYARP